ncbi:NADPH-dependent FMN reductase [Sneathiella aquimaris]|uniref:NADPH-dependent FMN reductase n=1 Tax=Sneathiella aquimaris TaxID=2599305 RepID=UPI00146E6A5C|nr:NAD(P)H-dependent oxidoreductase [Sneathiella aquimaris]
MIKIGIVIGSIRENSESSRVSHYVDGLLHRTHLDCDTEIFDLRLLDLPLWTEDKWDSNSPVSQNWLPLSRKLSECDGFVFVVPEWAGMAPPHLKNFLLMCDKGELAHKPCQLIGISSGMGGAYPVAELRMSGYKNNMLMWLPDHMILRNVTKLFADTPPNSLDLELTERLNYSLGFLVDTAIALKPVREKNQNLKKYKNGM